MTRIVDCPTNTRNRICIMGGYNCIMRKGNRDLIGHLFDNGTIKRKEVAEAMERVDRQYYAPRYPY